jgi:hypothetical protein
MDLCWFHLCLCVGSTWCNDDTGLSTGISDLRGKAGQLGSDKMSWFSLVHATASDNGQQNLVSLVKIKSLSFRLRRQSDMWLGKLCSPNPFSEPRTSEICRVLNRQQMRGFTHKGAVSPRGTGSFSVSKSMTDVLFC